MFNIFFADDWILTADLWIRKRPLYQLSHNHCPRCVTIFKQVLIRHLNLIIFLRSQSLIFGRD